MESAPDIAVLNKALQILVLRYPTPGEEHHMLEHPLPRLSRTWPVPELRRRLVAFRITHAGQASSACIVMG